DMRRRRGGVLIPLFSFPSTTSWGIGDVGDLVPMARWLTGAGMSVLQLLPINEMAVGQQSPYSAISAMAIDPIYICMADVPEFAALGGEASLDREELARLGEARHSNRILYETIRPLKQTVLRRAFDRFIEREWQTDCARAQDLRAFVSEQAWW